jgi:hypothetical protein
VNFVVRPGRLGGKKVWSRLDAESSMPNAAKRVRELWGPNSPYRK